MVPVMTNAGRADAVRGQDDVTACANAATTMTLRDEVSRGREREYGWPSVKLGAYCSQVGLLVSLM